jgi:hypothetical protein
MILSPRAAGILWAELKAFLATDVTIASSAAASTKPGEWRCQQKPNRLNSKRAAAVTLTSRSKFRWRDGGTHRLARLARSRQGQGSAHRCRRTFYLLLALFPALAAFVSLYGFVADPVTVADHVSHLGGLLPSAGVDIIRSQLQALASQNQRALGIGLLTGLAIALWSANGRCPSYRSASLERLGQPGVFVLNVEDGYAAVLFLLRAQGRCHSRSRGNGS